MNGCTWGLNIADTSNLLWHSRWRNFSLSFPVQRILQVFGRFFSCPSHLTFSLYLSSSLSVIPFLFLCNRQPANYLFIYWKDSFAFKTTLYISYIYIIILRLEAAHICTRSRSRSWILRIIHEMNERPNERTRAIALHYVYIYMRKKTHTHFEHFSHQETE